MAIWKFCRSYDFSQSWRFQSLVWCLCINSNSIWFSRFIYIRIFIQKLKSWQLPLDSILSGLVSVEILFTYQRAYHLIGGLLY